MTDLAAICAPYHAPLRLLSAFPDLEPVPLPSGLPGWCVQDRELRGAFGCAPEEAQILYDLVASVRPARALEIGAYVGWSTAHIAAALPHGAWLDVVDPFIEGDGGALRPQADLRVRTRFHANLRRGRLTHMVRLSLGMSPGVLPSLSGGWAFVHIDGYHHHGQPLADVRGALPYLADGATIVLHDAHIPEVRAAAGWLDDYGWTVEELMTPNGMFVAREGV